MRYAEYAVTGASAHFVKCLWSLAADAAEASAAAVPILPDGRVELLLSTGDPVDRDGDIRGRQPSREIAGQMTTAVRIVPRGRVDIIGVRLHPWAAGTFLRVPMRQLRDRMLPAHDLPLAERLLCAAGSIEDPDERLERLQLDIERHARTLASPHPAARALTRILMNGPSSVTVRALAQGIGLGARRVQGIFAEQVGISPRTLARIARLQRALGTARRHPHRTLSAVAHDSGYYDHAHFVRDCRDIAGEAPGSVLGRASDVTTAFLDSEPA
jgi:AraC-like DNA-binding protein